MGIQMHEKHRPLQAEKQTNFRLNTANAVVLEEDDFASREPLATCAHIFDGHR